MPRALGKSSKLIYFDLKNKCFQFSWDKVIRNLVETTAKKLAVPCNLKFSKLYYCQSLKGRYINRAYSMAYLSIEIDAEYLTKEKIIKSFTKCPIISFYCSKSDECISQLQVCDGVGDCLYGEDEINCSMSFFVCKNREKISVNYVCNFLNDCSDGSDEQLCC